MTKVILTGVDGSETAQEAAEKAAGLAAALRAELHVMSAFSVDLSETLRTVRSNEDPSAIAEAVKNLTVRYADEAERTAAAVAEKLRAEFPGLKITSRAAEGSPGSALANEAERVQADTIVVGNKRVQGPARILGSVARTVASEANCDLYIVNTHPR